MAASSSVVQAELVWIPAPSDRAQDVWSPAQVVTEERGGTLKVMLLSDAAAPAGGEETVAKKDAIKTFFPFSRAEGLEDMTVISNLEEPDILFNLRRRFARDDIYTNIGNVLVSVNPYKRLSIYSNSHLESFIGVKPNSTGPHVYAIGNRAYNALVTTSRPQCFVVSGESGSGKTELSKFLLMFLTTQATSARVSNVIRAKILAANPVLEAFGNAKTVRNNNSSRFGKYIALHFNAGGKVMGASMTHYLLEKSRIVDPGQGERSYHVFYQMIAGASPTERRNWSLFTSADDYYYLGRSGCTRIDHVDDATEFRNLKDSLAILDFSSADQAKIFKLVAAVLMMGNIEFHPNRKDEAVIHDTGPVSTVCTLLELADVDAFVSALTTRSISTGRSSVYTKPLTVDEAVKTRDTCAKNLYSRLFDYLVGRINHALSLAQRTNTYNKAMMANAREAARTAASTSTSGGGAGASGAAGGPGGGVQLEMGILDIFGFEEFPHNYFEQFCINYANEKLQQLFIKCVYKEQEAEYRREGIRTPHIDYVDNQDVIDLVEQRWGIFKKLAEEARIPNGSSSRLLTKMHVEYADQRNHAHYICNRPTALTQFGIRHYAGDIFYEIDGFMEKDNESAPEAFEQINSFSAMDLMVKLYPGGGGDPEFEEPSIALRRTQFTMATNRPGSGRRGRGSGGRNRSSGGGTGQKGKGASLSDQFKTSLGGLMQTLEAADPHFVRCVKPNNNQVPDEFDGAVVLSQLRSLGIQDTIVARRVGYPVSFDIPEFHARFFFLAPRHRNPSRSSCEAILAAYQRNGGGASTSAANPSGLAPFVFGTSRVYLRYEVLDELEVLRRNKVLDAVRRIQPIWRGAVTRKRTRAMIEEVRRRKADEARRARERAEAEAAAARERERERAAEQQRLEDSRRAVAAQEAALERKNSRVRQRIRNRLGTEDAEPAVASAVGGLRPIREEDDDHNAPAGGNAFSSLSRVLTDVRACVDANVFHLVEESRAMIRYIQTGSKDGRSGGTVEKNEILKQLTMLLKTMKAISVLVGSEVNIAEWNQLAGQLVTLLKRSPFDTLAYTRTTERLTEAVRAAASSENRPRPLSVASPPNPVDLSVTLREAIDLVTGHVQDLVKESQETINYVQQNKYNVDRGQVVALLSKMLQTVKTISVAIGVESQAPVDVSVWSTEAAKVIGVVKATPFDANAFVRDVLALTKAVKAGASEAIAMAPHATRDQVDKLRTDAEIESRSRTLAAQEAKANAARESSRKADYERERARLERERAERAAERAEREAEQRRAREAELAAVERREAEMRGRQLTGRFSRRSNVSSDGSQGALRGLSPASSAGRAGGAMRGGNGGYSGPPGQFFEACDELATYVNTGKGAWGGAAGGVALDKQLIIQLLTRVMQLMKVVSEDATDADIRAWNAVAVSLVQAVKASPFRAADFVATSYQLRDVVKSFVDAKARAGAPVAAAAASDPPPPSKPSKSLKYRSRDKNQNKGVAASIPPAQPKVHEEDEVDRLLDQVVVHVQDLIKYVEEEFFVDTNEVAVKMTNMLRALKASKVTDEQIAADVGRLVGHLRKPPFDPTAFNMVARNLLSSVQQTKRSRATEDYRLWEANNAMRERQLTDRRKRHEEREAALRREEARLRREMDAENQRAAAVDSKAREVAALRAQRDRLAVQDQQRRRDELSQRQAAEAARLQQIREERERLEREMEAKRERYRQQEEARKEREERRRRELDAKKARLAEQEQAQAEARKRYEERLAAKEREDEVRRQQLLRERQERQMQREASDARRHDLEAERARQAAKLTRMRAAAAQGSSQSVAAETEASLATPGKEELQSILDGIFVDSIRNSWHKGTVGDLHRLKFDMAEEERSQRADMARRGETPVTDPRRDNKPSMPGMPSKPARAGVTATATTARPLIEEPPPMPSNVGRPNTGRAVNSGYEREQPKTPSTRPARNLPSGRPTRDRPTRQAPTPGSSKPRLPTSPNPAQRKRIARLKREKEFGMRDSLDGGLFTVEVAFLKLRKTIFFRNEARVNDAMYVIATKCSINYEPETGPTRYELVRYVNGKTPIPLEGNRPLAEYDLKPNDVLRLERK